jgi:hypothetical protein
MLESLVENCNVTSAVEFPKFPAVLSAARGHRKMQRVRRGVMLPGGMRTRTRTKEPPR